MGKIQTYDGSKFGKTVFKIINYTFVEFPKGILRMLLYMQPILIWILYREIVNEFNGYIFTGITLVAILGAVWQTIDAVDDNNDDEDE